jgi:hypothetical protein
VIVAIFFIVHPTDMFLNLEPCAIGGGSRLIASKSGV